MKSFPVRFVLLAAALMFTFVRCGSDSVTAPSGVVSVTLNPTSAVLKVGTTVQLSVTTTLDGVPVTGQTITFSSDNSAVVSVSSTGLLRALTIGTANITAKSSSGASAVGAVTVVAGNPASVTKTAGDNQGATVGTAVSVAPSVTVRDSAGNPVSGVTVTFAITGGVGSITGATATTNAAGVAAVGSWIMGPSVGGNTLSATVTGVTPATFTATAIPNPIGSLAISAGNGQSTATGVAVGVAPSVLVLNGIGQPSAGVAVTFAVASGGGTITGATQTTNAAGIATVGSWTLGAVGANTLTATVAGLAPVTFTATATAPGTIGLNTATLSYSVNLGAATAGTQSINIFNSGGGSLTGLSVGTVAYGAGASGWLTATLNANTAPAVLTVVTNTSGLTTAGTFTATIPVLATGATNSPQTVTVTLNLFPVAPPNTVVITTQPAGTNTGVVLSTQPVVKITDITGATVTSMNGPVAASLASGVGTLGGTTTVNAVNGIATFTNLKITGSGQFALGFSAPGANGATSQPFAIAALPATQIGIATQPSGASSNVVLTTPPVVELRDVNGNPALGATGPVTVAIGAGGTGVGTLSGTTSVNAVNGVATFTNLKLSAAGTYTLTFSSGALPPITSSLFTVATSPPVSVAVTTQPTGAQTGSLLATQPVVALRDVSNATVIGATNNVTATLNGAGGVLSGTTTVAAVNGVATFTDLVITGSGTYTLTFASAGVTSAASSSFVITPLPPTQLGIATQPIGGGTGSFLTTGPVIQVRDALGSTVVGATNAVTATLVGAGGVLTGVQTVNAVNGVASFSNLIVTGPGTYTLSFTAAGLTSATSASFTITALPPTQLGVLTQPTGAVTGAPLTTQPVIQVKDVNGAVVTGAVNTVTATLNGGGALSGTTSVAAVNGVATFTNLVVTGSGTYSITFSSTGLGSALSQNIVITALPATQLVVGTQPGGAATGAVLSPQPSVQVRDASNGLVAGATNSVTATLVGAGGVLSGTQTVNAINGTATFSNLVVSGPGSYTLSFTSAGLTTAASSSFTITALPPAQLAFGTQPSGGATGSPLATQPVIQLKDVNGGVVAGATNSVTATLNGGGGALSGTTTVAAVNGVATFTNLVVTGVGTYTLSFASAGLTGAVSQAVVITALPPTQLAVATQPGNGNTGSLLSPQPVVQVRDVNNGVVAGTTNAVTATLVGAGGVLSGTQTVNAVNGVATFTNLIVTGPGSYTISFTAAGLTTATSTAFTIAALPPTQLGIATQPSGAATGAPFSTQPVIQIKDVNGGVVAGATNTVTATIGAGSAGTLSGGITVAAVNGVATFTNLVITGTGNSTIVFTSAGLTSATSATIAVSALPPTQLGIGSQPTTGFTTQALTPSFVIQVKDVNGGVAAGATNLVTATIGGGSAGTLSGTTTVNAVNGVATFSNLILTGTGNSTIVFTSGALTQATSANIAIAALPPTQLGIATQPSGAATGSALTTQPVIQIKDVNGGVVAGATNTVTATIGAGSAGALSGTTTVAAVNGVAAFTNLVIIGTGNSTIVFTSAGLTSATSATIAVSALPATQLGIASQPTTGVTTQALAPSVVVQVKDANGGVVAGATNSVTATIGGGSAGTLSGTTTVSAVNGVATFSNLILTGTGNSTIVFTSGALTQATSANIAVAALPATQLALGTAPSGGATTQAFTTQPVIQVKDVNGGVVAGATNLVTASIATGTGSISGNTAAAVNGVATFTNLTITGTGNFTITFSAAGLTPVTTGTIAVSALPATKLAIATQPAAVNVTPNGVLTTQPVVQVQNVNSGVVGGATNAVTAVLSAGGTLLGTQTVNAVNGVATFTNLAVSAAGTYTLSFTSAGLTSTPASTSFTILPPFIALNIGSSATANGTQNVDLAIPVIVDMSQAAGQNLASLQFDFTWDPTKFTFDNTGCSTGPCVKITNGTLGSSAPTVNPNSSATGKITVGFFDNFGITSGSPTVITITLRPIAAATNAQVTATVTLAADQNGTNVVAPVNVRALSVTTP